MRLLYEAFWKPQVISNFLKHIHNGNDLWMLHTGDQLFEFWRSKIVKTKPKQSKLMQSVNEQFHKNPEKRRKHHVSHVQILCWGRGFISVATTPLTPPKKPAPQRCLYGQGCCQSNLTVHEKVRQRGWKSWQTGPGSRRSHLPAHLSPASALGRRLVLGLWGPSHVMWLGLLGGSDGEESACNTEDLSLIPGSGRSPGEGNCNHSRILVWKTPWTEEPGELQSMGPKSQTWLSN